MVPYVVSECIGAVLASAVVRTMFPEHETLRNVPTAGGMQAFVLEFILTLLLMFVVLSVSTGSKEKGVLAGVAVGSLIASKHCSPGPSAAHP